MKCNPNQEKEGQKGIFTKEQLPSAELPRKEKKQEQQKQKSTVCKIRLNVSSNQRWHPRVL
jgi:hypothetical protein